MMTNKNLESIQVFISETLGTITGILASPDSEIRENLDKLWKKLAEEARSINYNPE